MNTNLFIVGMFAVALTACSGSPKKQDSAAAPAAKTAAPTAKSGATTAAAAAPSEQVTLCKHGKEVRTLRLETLSPKGCKLLYSPKGDEPVAQSQVGTQHCEGVRAKIQEKLEGAGMKCSSSEEKAAVK